MSAYSYKTIMLKGAEFSMKEEANAGEASIYPGMFLQFQSDGDFELEDDDDAIMQLLIAVEDDMEGSTIDTAYTSGRKMQARWVPIGAEVFTWLAKGHSVTKAGWLSSAGLTEQGCLGAAQNASAEDAVANFIAMETVDNSAGSAAVRIVAKRVR
jgi:hypothetical protein